MKSNYLVVAVFVLGLAGCSTLKVRHTPSNLPITAQAARAEMQPGWSDPAVIRDGIPLVVITSPMTPPRIIQQRQISIRLAHGASIRDIAAILSHLGYSVLITDKAAADARVIMPRYRGTLGGLMRALQLAGNVWFTWQDDAIVISSKATIAISLPQDQDLANRIAAGLTPYGFKEKAIPISAEAGIISLRLRPSSYVAVRDYLSRITENAALVNMQVALVNVQLTQDASQGFNWSKLQLAIGGGSNSLLNTLNPTTGSALQSNTLTNNATIGNTATTASASSTSSTNPDANVTPNGSVLSSLSNGGTSTTVTLPNTGVGELISNGALRGVLSTDAFSMIGFINFLESYGTTKTVQSVMLRTVTGQQVELKSVTQIPYVTGVGIGGYGGYGGGYGGYGGGYGGYGGYGGEGMGGSQSMSPTPNLSGFGDSSNTTSGGTSPGSAPSSTGYPGGSPYGYSPYGGLMGSAGTSVANNGITLKLLPAYDAAADTVTIELALSLQSVIGFNTLSAGNQIGNLTQPTTADQTFNDTLRMRPGQTMVVGGFTYNQIKRNNAVPLFLPNKAGNSSLSVKREAMFIVVRPTVTILGALKNSNAQAFDVRTSRQSSVASGIN